MLRQAQHEREGWRPLTAHPDTPAHGVDRVEARVARDGDVWTVAFRVDDAASLTPGESLVEPVRTDELWRHLCFELFVKPAGERRYLEFNFAPTNRWAAYAFDDYRSGMRDLALTGPPSISGVLNARVDLSGLSIGACSIGLSAVIEETDGTRSYWALAHPPGKPDFHHPACFALEVPAPERP